MNIDYIPAGFDSGMNNLMWLMVSTDRRSAVIVDPGYIEPIQHYLQHQNLLVSDILITHHHYDHTDGIATLQQDFPDVKVYGPTNSPCSLITYPLKESDEVYLESLDKRFKVIETPGHTLDHICYYADDDGVCFVGDTVFGAGAGALFEGTAEVFQSSIQKIMNLPDMTKLYYGHDYTLENLYFAKKIEKSNTHVEQRIQDCRLVRDNNQYNGFSTVALEHLSNPFWRFDKPEIKASCECYAGHKLNTNLDVFATIRQWR